MNGLTGTQEPRPLTGTTVRLKAAHIVRCASSKSGNPSYLLVGWTDDGRCWSGKTIPNGSVAFGLPNLIGRPGGGVLTVEVDARGRVVRAANDRGAA